MSRHLTFERIGTTEDTDDPVVQVSFDDVGSRADLIIPSDDEEIRVWFVTSKVEGDMSRIIDEVVQQTDRTRVVFLSPLNLSGDGGIRNKLHNYDEVTVNTPRGKQTQLIVDWKL